MINIVELSHKILSQCEHSNTAIDMTAGKGNDTLFLASIANTVIAFAIQEAAILATKQALEKNHISNVTVIQESHDLFDIYVNREFDLAIYNLGYLPGSDKEIKTDAKTVLRSLEKALSLLSVGGIIVIVIYLHDHIEDLLITDYVSQLGPEFDVLKLQVLNKKDSPYLISITRTKK
ncbi:MAG: class I SAM-dependent methyltransferase [Bacilli bacterium]|nr:class I SAM-dependent methyltransferase [Bacilli bacterium]MBN2876609.1 class I SAM-dependent methyltransferase [Bacilli bacterium]